jgi:hypothetical protein
MSSSPRDELDVAGARLRLTREEILSHRRSAGWLDERLPLGPESLRRAGWAGLQDSMPRAALLSIHARIAGTEPTTLDDPSLVQVWGPRYSAYVVAASDHAIFTLGRMPPRPKFQAFSQGLADQLEGFLGGRRLGYGEAGDQMGIPPNRLRYAALTGRVQMRWSGARQPTIWMVPPPDVDPMDARLELARRYLNVYGPASASAFAKWAGVGRAEGPAAFEALGTELVPVTTPIGQAWILADDEPTYRESVSAATAVRLLPSGDTWFLLYGRDRELLVPDPTRRAELWTSRVWPGALYIAGEIVGTWRRAQGELSITTWGNLSPSERSAVEAEAASLRLPGIERNVVVRWGNRDKGQGR